MILNVKEMIMRMISLNYNYAERWGSAVMRGKAAF